MDFPFSAFDVIWWKTEVKFCSLVHNGFFFFFHPSHAEGEIRAGLHLHIIIARLVSFMSFYRCSLRVNWAIFAFTIYKSRATMHHYVYRWLAVVLIYRCNQMSHTLSWANAENNAMIRNSKNLQKHTDTSYSFRQAPMHHLSLKLLLSMAKRAHSHGYFYCLKFQVIDEFVLFIGFEGNKPTVSEANGSVRT